MIVDAVRFGAPRLRFDAAIPSRVHAQSYQGLRLHGPYDNSRVRLADKSLLFVFPEELRALSRQLAKVLANGQGSYPGFEKMFRVELDTQTTYDSLVFDTDLSDRARAATAYRDAIAEWNTRPRAGDPELAIVLVPHSERWEVEQPYYEAKSAFAQLGIPTQMVTGELVANPSQFGWAVANIALAAFAKLGGVPWTVEAADDSDLVIGIGRADVRTAAGQERIFGYALAFIGNGVYRHTWAFQPVADEETYEAKLEDAVVAAFGDETRRDQPPRRLVVHLTRKTGKREIEAVERAMTRSGVELPVAFMRLDPTSLYDIADGNQQQTFGPPKGLAVRLGERRMLLQSEEVNQLGAPDGPLLVELDARSSVPADDLPALVEQAFRLSHASWRGFNARSQPVTVGYSELLARLAGYLAEIETWQPQFLRSELQERPWFL